MINLSPAVGKLLEALAPTIWARLPSRNRRTALATLAVASRSVGTAIRNRDTRLTVRVTEARAAGIQFASDYPHGKRGPTADRAFQGYSILLAQCQLEPSRLQVAEVLPSETVLASNLDALANDIDAVVARDRLAARVMAVLACLAAAAGLVFAALWWDSNRNAVAVLRDSITRDSFWGIDPPYRTEVRDHGIAPSQCKNIVDRRFRMTQFSESAVGLPSPGGTLLMDLHEAQAAIVHAIAAGSPQVILTGRIGSGLGYVWAHLFARILEDASREPGPLRIAGRERWAFLLRTSQLDATECRTTQGITSLLLRQVKSSSAEAGVAERDIARHSIILLMIEPCLDLDASLTALARFVDETQSCLVAAPPLDMLDRWNAHNLRVGQRLVMLQYNDDESTKLVIARAVARQYCAKNAPQCGEDVVASVAQAVLQDPYGRDFATYNWRISQSYMEEWVKLAGPLPRAAALSLEQSQAAATAGLRKSIRLFAQHWIGRFLAGAFVDASVDVNTLAQLTEAVVMAAGQRPLEDSDVDARIRTAMAPRLLPTRLAELTPIVRGYLLGSPFFRFDANNDLSWIPFSPDAPTLLGGR